MMEQEREYIFEITVTEDGPMITRAIVPEFLKNFNVHRAALKRLEFGQGNYIALDQECGQLLIRGTIVRPVSREVTTKWGLE